eukprot:SAG31_NODE_17659_length_662_cov_1.433393_1_plen_174_part_00
MVTRCALYVGSMDSGRCIAMTMLQLATRLRPPPPVLGSWPRRTPPPVLPPRWWRWRSFAAEAAEAAPAVASPPPAEVGAVVRELFLAGKGPQKLGQSRVVAAVTGGGGPFWSFLLGVPGASTCLLEGVVPYDKQSCVGAPRRRYAGYTYIAGEVTARPVDSAVSGQLPLHCLD